jgi:predicted ATPase/class 3 adenylate cyclase
VASPPTGTVTFLFTDIEGSTKLWEHNAQAMQVALTRHDKILKGAIEERGGYVFKTVGDAFCCAFWTATDALDAALEVQRTLFGEEWQETDPLRVRMALHTGVAEERDGDYFGPPVNRVARLLSAAHGGQVLLSLPTQELVRDQLPAGTSLRDLGEYRLKDLFRPERVFQFLAPELPSEFPPLRTLDAHWNNLPVQPTPLVGREREVAWVCERLLSPEVRLLTLTGPGGTGKTRVGLQAAADLLEEFEDGVYFVALATLTDPGLVAPTVTQALGVAESGEKPPEEALKEHLRDREVLLLMDNFEQVLEATPLLEELLAAAPRLRVLATSRAALRLYGEHEYSVPPLALPDPTYPPPPERLTQYEAVRLFVERARAVKADFEVTNENAPAVAEICVRLDGLPLALELAAARIRLLPPRSMLARLGSRLKLLTGGARNLPERQRTLRGAIEWSYELLTPEERTLFARLSVFAGGRTLEAIETICDSEGGLDTLDGLESLIEKSLLRQEEGSGGEARFVMLETIHEYAREKLGESGEAEVVRSRHAEHFLALAEEAEPELKGARQLEWLDRLEEEHDNIRAALGWSFGAGEVEEGLRIAGALSWFWHVRGHLSEGRRWLEEGLAKAGEGVAPSTRAKALVGLGVAVEVQEGDYEKAAPLYEKGLAMYRKLGDREGIANCLCNLGVMVGYAQGDHERSTALLEESLGIYQELGDEHGIASVLNALGMVASIYGDFARAATLYEEALALSREAGDAAGVARLLGNLSYAVLLQGDHGRAKTLAEEALAMSREQGNTLFTSVALTNLGLAAREQGDHDRAAAALNEALTLAWDIGDKLGVVETLEGISGLIGILKEDQRAERLWGAAQAWREATGALLADGDRALNEPYLDAARSRLGDARWEEALSEGRAMTLERATAYALEEGEGVRSARASGERG